MTRALFIMAHGGAQATVDDFLPKWKALDTQLYCSLPEGEDLYGFQRYVHCGKSAYSGFHVFERFILTLEAAIATNAEVLTVAEYDTVPLRPEMPKFKEGHITSYFVAAESATKGNGVKLCSLSPWTFDHATAIRFAAAFRESLATDGDFAEEKGVLDRWIGHVIKTKNLPWMMGYDCFGYPWWDVAHDCIRHLRYNWIHGWKRKEEFGDLWT